MLGHNWLDERGAEGIGYVKAVGSLLPERMRDIMPDMRVHIKRTFDTCFSNVKTAADGLFLRSRKSPRTDLVR